MQLLTYTIEEGQMEDEEEKYQDQRRKSMRGARH